jgi:HAMP domain-containing protein
MKPARKGETLVREEASGVLELKRTIIAMRAELEQMQFDKRQTGAKQTAALRDEIGQLKAAIVALRQELERRAAAHAEEVQALQRRGRDEQKQLQDMIVALRERLQNGHA